MSKGALGFQLNPSHEIIKSTQKNHCFLYTAWCKLAITIKSSYTLHGNSQPCTLSKDNTGAVHVKTDIVYKGT
jgi:hypothetical protein